MGFIVEVVLAPPGGPSSGTERGRARCCLTNLQLEDSW